MYPFFVLLLCAIIAIMPPSFCNNPVLLHPHRVEWFPDNVVVCISSKKRASRKRGGEGKAEIVRKYTVLHSLILPPTTVLLL